MKNIFLIIILSFIFSEGSINYSISDSLPSNMPLVKKLLWGKDGFVRKLNLAPDSRTEELKLRSKMLQLHQKLGLINLGLMGVQMYLGCDMYNKGNRYYSSSHRISSPIEKNLYLNIID